ncbi:MAG: hypothetical protein GXP41_05725 [Chloroflexi bacterium]|nr:hypothetical protein [Chloroflexota bacterium]
MSDKDIYLEMAHHPQVILDTMEKMEQDVDRLAQRRKRLRTAGTILGGCGGLTLFGVFLLVFFGTLIAGPLGLIVAGVGFVLGFPALLAGFALNWYNQSKEMRPHFAAAKQILYTLRDDTGRKGRVVGQLDLSGARRDDKKARTTRSLGGKQKVYYRDPWFQVKIKLVDGNLLRLALIDKVKTKSGSMVARHTQLSTKLVVNPNLYRVGGVPSSGYPLQNAVVSGGDGIFTVKAEVNTIHENSTLPIAPLLETLRSLYRHLEPIGSVPGLPVDSSSPSLFQKLHGQGAAKTERIGRVEMLNAE